MRNADWRSFFLVQPKTPASSGGSGKLIAISPFVSPCARIKQGLPTAKLAKERKRMDKNTLAHTTWNCKYHRLPLIIAPKPAVSSSVTQSFEKKRSSSALFAREINLVTQPSFDCEQGINSQVQTACSNADAIFPVLGIVFCKNERFSLLRKTHVPLWNAPRISHVRLP